MKAIACVAVAAASLSLAACQGTGADPHAGHDHARHDHAAHAAQGAPRGGERAPAAVARHGNMWESVRKGVAVLVPKSDSKVAGTIRFEDSPEGLRVTGEVTGLKPGGTHAMHIHEFGDATDAKGDAAGGHYNPEGHKHAGPEAAERHAGDFGNITADASGKATLNLTFKNVSVAGLKNPVMGRSLVIHANADDLKSDPAGNAGPRIAVGVIGVAK